MNSKIANEDVNLPDRILAHQTNSTGYPLYPVCNISDKPGKAQENIVTEDVSTSNEESEMDSNSLSSISLDILSTELADNQEGMGNESEINNDERVVDHFLNDPSEDSGE